MEGHSPSESGSRLMDKLPGSTSPSTTPLLMMLWLSLRDWTRELSMHPLVAIVVWQLLHSNVLTLCPAIMLQTTQAGQ